MMKHNNGNGMTPYRQERKPSVLFEVCSDLLATKQDYVPYIDHQYVFKSFKRVYSSGHMYFQKDVLCFSKLRMGLETVTLCGDLWGE
jgi:hypothetical protein